MTSIGPLVPADESFNHQITDTFAAVGQSDHSWTEKVCAQACAQDGTLQLAFGLGKYTNRGVMDAYAGVSRGVEQWTVRASRSLAPEPDLMSIGPIHYEVLEPLKAIRFALDANDAVPISFEWIFEGVVPPFLENREVHRSPDGYRLDADIVRYHQSGVARGWVSVGGRRIDLDDSSWVSTRDHSWGVRYMVGAPLADAPARDVPEGVSTLIMWSPIVCERDDGSRYALHWFYQRHALGSFQRVELQGGVERPDGTKQHFAGLVPDIKFRDDNRRFLGGILHFTMADGGDRPITVHPVSDTGFHLGTGLYFGFDGQYHGQFRGRLSVDGEYFADCSDPGVARRIHQFRDCVVRVEDPAGGGVGYGNLQCLAIGPDQAMGLTAEASFM